MRLLLDGWPLSYEPGSPAALHMAAVIATLPASIQPLLVLPGPDPGIEDLPASLEILVQETEETAWGLLVWQQVTLPRLANQAKAGLVLTAKPGASLLGPVPTLSSPSGWGLGGFDRSSGLRGKRGIGFRLQESFGMGGLNRALAVLWPEDLPAQKGSISLVRIPPLVHPLFQSSRPSPAIEFWSGVNLPETYILYHGPLDQTSVVRLMEVWSWAASSIAAYYPLVIYGCQEPERKIVLEIARRLQCEDNLLLLPPANPVQLAALYYGCSALVNPGSVSPWGDPMRHALACAKPVVAAVNPMSDALVGRAGYLVPAKDLRALGAALITVIVEDELAERLSTEAQQRARSWPVESFWLALAKYFPP
jgi:glycosyltransferase involved in cell wall biosynthesis